VVEVQTMSAFVFSMLVCLVKLEQVDQELNTICLCG